MYNISSLDPNHFPKLKIRNQAKILELTGSKFDPLKAYEIIKAETEGFTRPNEKAIQADALYSELLKLNGISIEKKTPVPSKVNKARIREKERARGLKLLELELAL